ncbi:Serine/threonine-phosphatase-like protein [Sarcoptes scabiei]|uniref:Serine/threonine-phosphatase-like protein n=1 Tax=Sarcoptes scabiei TaxID=52283 RepID=A0A131ZVB0_SARSC|nr:Serine/threonine-phosphatase-like protein [Sarcoptes scabiei]
MSRENPLKISKDADTDQNLSSHPSLIDFDPETVIEIDSVDNETNKTNTNQRKFPFDMKQFDRHNRINSLDKDCCCLAIICINHRQIALKKFIDNLFFFPTLSIISSTESFDKVLRQFFSNHSLPEVAIESVQIIDVWRFRHPTNNHFVTRTIYRILLEDRHRFVCFTNSETLFWFSVDDLERMLKVELINFDDGRFLWGVEPYRILCGKSIRPNRSRSLLREIEWPMPIDRSLVSNALEYACVNLEDVETFYNEFLLHCYPSETISFISFIIFMLRIGITNQRIQSFDDIIRRSKMLFNCFKNDYDNDDVMTFQSLLIGLTIMNHNRMDLNQDEKFEHQASDRSFYFALKRFEYLFRYYDLDQNERIDFEEFRFLMNDYIGKLRDDYRLLSSKIEWIELDQARDRYIRSLFLKQAQNLDNLLDKIHFQLLIIDLTRNNPTIPSLMSVLLRSPFDLFVLIGARFSFTAIFNQRYRFLGDNLEFKYSICPVCARKPFFLSNQMINLGKRGTIVDMFRLELIRREENYFETFREEESINENYVLVLANNILTRLNKLAMIVFPMLSTANDSLIVSDRDLKNIENWFFKKRKDLFDAIRIILIAVRKIFARESRILKIQSPSYVFGDLNGNFRNLFRYSKQFWNCSPFLNISNYLFLGNLIGSNDWNLECIIYIFCYKILAPKSFFFLRGMNEIVSVSKRFRFLDSCEDLSLRFQLTQLIQASFDQISICAMIDDRIYCANRGLPKNIISLLEQVERLSSTSYHKNAWLNEEVLEISYTTY